MDEGEILYDYNLLQLEREGVGGGCGVWGGGKREF